MAIQTALPLMGMSIYRKSGTTIIWLCPYIGQETHQDDVSVAFISCTAWHARRKDEIERCGNDVSRCRDKRRKQGTSEGGRWT